uniref:Uncharacterized protein n=1 Tax=Picea sitchensis TaxID=3332 RepID=D5ADM6_PICSI|nr:unknown [Picea sitchensis]
MHLLFSNKLRNCHYKKTNKLRNCRYIFILCFRLLYTATCDEYETWILDFFLVSFIV